MAHRRGSFRSRAPRRGTQWDALPGWGRIPFQTPGIGSVLAFSEFNNVLVSGPVPPPTPLTLVKTIFDWSANEGNDGAFFGAIGGLVVTQQALDEALLGTKTLPLPVEDAASDVWFLHSFISGVQRSTVLTERTDGSNIRGQIISKGMRKIDDGYQIVFVGQRDDETSVFGSNFTLEFNLRALVKV